ncbi:MAG: DUF6599 family protein [Acidobacteriota bacterium]
MILVLLLALALAAAGDEARPAAGALPGWQPVGTTVTFRGSELYGHIDGGAEIFLELGFEEVTVDRHERAGAELVVEHYRMSDAAAALGIYLMKCGRETPDPRLPERHSCGRLQLQLVKGSHFLVITNDSGAPELAASMVALAALVAEKLAASPPVVFPGLAEEGLRPGSLRILRGSYGLEALATLGEGDILLLGGKVTAVAGSYEFPGGPGYTLIRADYGAPAAALHAFANLRAHLDRYLEVTASRPACLAWREANGKHGRALTDDGVLTIHVAATVPFSCPAPAPEPGTPTRSP